MTDAEIKQALECCKKAVFHKDCLNLDCPFATEYGCNISQSDLRNEALDLINRQQAEIADERAKGNICAEVIARQDKEIAKYKAEIKNYSQNNRSLANAVTEMQKALKKQSAEIERLKKLLDEEEEKYKLCAKHFYIAGVKVFAELLKKEVEMISYEMCSNYQDTIDAIDETYKEMVGDAE